MAGKFTCLGMIACQDAESGSEDVFVGISSVIPGKLA